jgi:hypothetical protein
MGYYLNYIIIKLKLKGDKYFVIPIIYLNKIISKLLQGSGQALNPFN